MSESMNLSSTGFRNDLLTRLSYKTWQRYVNIQRWRQMSKVAIQSHGISLM